MKLGGFQPFTLSDFPGRIAAIVFTQGCNFRCPFCHNGALINADASANAPTEDEVLAFLAGRRGKLEGVVVSGGEPTIQPDLPDFLRQVRALGYQIKLDTNGSRPEVIAALLEEGLVDYIAMDLKAPLESYHRLSGVSVPKRLLEESIAVISWSGLDHEFRTTVVEPLLSSADIQAIQGIVPSGSRHRLQPFRPEHALDPSLRQAAAVDGPARAVVGAA